MVMFTSRKGGCSSCCSALFMHSFRITTKTAIDHACMPVCFGLGSYAGGLLELGLHEDAATSISDIIMFDTAVTF